MLSMADNTKSDRDNLSFLVSRIALKREIFPNSVRPADLGLAGVLAHYPSLFLSSLDMFRMDCHKMQTSLLDLELILSLCALEEKLANIPSGLPLFNIRDALPKLCINKTYVLYDYQDTHVTLRPIRRTFHLWIHSKIW